MLGSPPSPAPGLGGGKVCGRAAGPTEHRSVVLREDLILGAVRKHIDEIAQVTQPVSQGPDGEIPCGEWLQVPQIAVRCERYNSFPQAAGGGSWLWVLRKAAEKSGLFLACTASPPPVLLGAGKRVLGKETPTRQKV